MLTTAEKYAPGTLLLDKPIVRVWNDGEQFNVHGNHIGNEMDPGTFCRILFS